MKKRIKKKLLRSARMIFSNKLYLSLFLFVLILPTILGFMFLQRQVKQASETVSAESIITKRFGECATCDVKDITSDSYVDANYKDINYGNQGILGFDQNTHVFFRFDLSGTISPNTAIEKAVIRFAMVGNPSGSKYDINQPIYSITDTSSLGQWEESGVTYNRRAVGVPWTLSNGNITTAYDTAQSLSSIYIRGYVGDRFAQTKVLQSDITSLVRQWVFNPSSNQGILIKGSNLLTAYLASSESSNYSLRPYIEITYEGENVDAPVQPTSISAKHYSGQTFLTWKEIVSEKDEVGYRIYKHTEPITEENLNSAQMIEQVYQGSSYLGIIYSEGGYGGAPPKQPDLSMTPGLNLALTSDTGLFVETARENGRFYYAVTSVVEGNENRSVILGSNSLQNESGVNEGIANPDAFYWGEYLGYTGYVMWVTNFDYKNPSDQYGLSNRRSNPVFFSVVLPHRQGYYVDTTSRKLMSPLQDQDPNNPTKYPITLNLHSISAGMYNSNEGMATSYLLANPERSGGFSLNFESSQKMFLKKHDGTFVFLGSFMENNTGSEYYSGWNTNYQPLQYSSGFIKDFKIPRPFGEGKSVPYGERQIRFVIEWMQNHRNWGKNIDKNRVYMTGGSLGGGGSHAFAIHNSDLVTAIDTTVGRTEIDPGCCEKNYEAAAYGTMEMNIPTPEGEGIFDYMNLSEYIKKNRSLNYPLIKTLHYKQDGSVFFGQVPRFYSALEEAKISHLNFFAQGDHNGCTKIVDSACVEWDAGFKFDRFPDHLTVLVPPRGSFVSRLNEPYYNIFHFKTNQSYPAFSNFSKNSDPGNGALASGDLRGAINRYQTWDTNSIVDTSTVYSINLSMYSNLPPIERSPGVYLDISDVETTDVTLRRLQNFAKGLPPGQRFKWQNIRLSDNAVIQEGGVLSDSDGLITIPSFQILKAGSKLSVEVINDGVVRATLPTSYSTYIGLPVTVAAFITGIVPTSANYFWTAPTGVELSQTDTNGSISALSKTYSTGGPPNAGYSLTLKILDGEPTTTLAEASTTLYVHKLADINGDNSINFTDFSTLLSSWGTPANPMANIIREGASATKVDFQDFSVLLSKWGS